MQAQRGRMRKAVLDRRLQARGRSDADRCRPPPRTAARRMSPAPTASPPAISGLLTDGRIAAWFDSPVITPRPHCRGTMTRNAVPCHARQQTAWTRSLPNSDFAAASSGSLLHGIGGIAKRFALNRSVSRSRLAINGELRPPVREGPAPPRSVQPVRAVSRRRPEVRFSRPPSPRHCRPAPSVPASIAPSHRGRAARS